MPRAAKEAEIYRREEKTNFSSLTKEEREQLVQPYLPPPPLQNQRQKQNRKSKIIAQASSNEPKTPSLFGIREFLTHQLHTFVYVVIHTIFSVYIRFRVFYHSVVDRIFAILYYHHRTPELIQKDVKALKRLPEHISVVLKLDAGGRDGTGLEALVDEVAEISAWCACIGIPTLSIYEETGILKSYIPSTHRAITRKFTSYFGPKSPFLSLKAPHIPSLESVSSSSPGALSVLLLDSQDGRDSLVDLTKTLTCMSQANKISSQDITIDLIDAEISESIMGEPDLLVLFGGIVELGGYPPWQIRLTEIFHVKDNGGQVGYQVFLRALVGYAGASMRFGR